MLSSVGELAPGILPFVHSAYSSPSSLYCGNDILQSSKGVQQGDPLGPLLFCLSLYHLHSQMRSEFCIVYLDDVTLGGNVEDLAHDLRVFQHEAAALGLQLNQRKSEIICNDWLVPSPILDLITDAVITDPNIACLLGSPIGNIEYTSKVIVEKARLLEIMCDRLQHLEAHDALLLLHHSLAVPKLLFTLQTARSFLSPSLSLYDDKLRSIVSSITNSHLTYEDHAWTQATLPVKYGGLGIRSAVQLAPSTFLVSAAGSSVLAHQLLPSDLKGTQLLYVAEGVALWSQLHSQPSPVDTLSHHQKSWDTPVVMTTFDTLLEDAPDATSTARLLATSTSESGAWLNALPISSLSLRMDNTIRVAVGIRLGTQLCKPHMCHHCGSEVDGFGIHGLSCRWSEGRHHRHSSLNNIVFHTMSAAKVPSRLEPSGIYHLDGKRQDCMSIVPWKSGKLLVWDVTCADTFTPSYTSIASSKPGAVAAQVEERKCSKYSHLSSNHIFTPLSIETSGSLSPKTRDFLKLGYHLCQALGEINSSSYLLQRLSIAVQHGNMASAMGSIGHSADMDFFA